MRNEKTTLQLSADIVAAGPRAVALADAINRLGGTVKIVDGQVEWAVPAENLDKATCHVIEFCGVPTAPLLPEADTEESEWDTDVITVVQ